MDDIPADRQTAAPTLSVIISTLNAGRVLARCLDSIQRQSFHDYEVIIVDGGSGDDTADVASRYASILTHFQSEPDSGIYDAWNKALKYARGEWVCFLGSDDQYTTAHALELFASRAHHPEVTLVSARVAMTDANGAVVRASGEGWTRTQMKKYMCVAHPGSWHHRSLFDNHGHFSTRFRLAGDYEFLLRSEASIRASFICEPLVTMELGGISNRRYWLHVRENFAALYSVSGGALYGVRFLFRACAGRAARKLRLRSKAGR